LSAAPSTAGIARFHTALDPQVCGTDDGQRGPYTPRGIEYLVAELGRRAQVPNVYPHRFRHDTARRLVESVDLPMVAARLGHERLDSVRIYGQPDEAALERAAAALENR
jgi:integrase